MKKRLLSAPIMLVAVAAIMVATPFAAKQYIEKYHPYHVSLKPSFCVDRGLDMDLADSLVSDANDSTEQCKEYGEIATTEDEHIKGLSGREAVDFSGALLFVFDSPAVQCMWMKDMKFPLDIAWADKDKTITKLTENISPDTYPDSFCSDSDALYVVETKAGMAKVYDFVPGAKIDFTVE